MGIGQGRPYQAKDGVSCCEAGGSLGSKDLAMVLSPGPGRMGPCGVPPLPKPWFPLWIRSIGTDLLGTVTGLDVKCDVPWC